MDTLSNEELFVKQKTEFLQGQIDFHVGAINRINSDPRGYAKEKRTALHTQTADQFRELISWMNSSKNVSNVGERPVPPTWQQLALRLEDIEDLPKELVDELSLSDGDRTDFAIIGLIEDAGGVSTIDRILIGLFRKTGEIHRRGNLTSRLYRLVQKGQLYSHGSKKGIYSTRELTTEESENLNA